MTFNFNHARYTENWEKKLEDAKSLGCQYKEAKQKNGIRRTISKEILNDDANFWQECSEIFIELVDDFFCQRGNFDYFGKNPPRKRNYIEKERQQQIALSNRETENGYFIYDIEYVQARNDKTEKSFGRPDMLAIRFEETKPKAIVFIELKSRIESTGDVKKHHSDMQDYLCEGSDENKLVETRTRDAVAIMNFYKKLGMANFDDELNPSQLKAEILFIFTDSAKSFKDRVVGDNVKNLDLSEPWIISH